MNNNILFFASNFLWLVAIIYFHYLNKRIVPDIKALKNYTGISALSCYFPDHIKSESHRKMALSDLVGYDIYAFQRADERVLYSKDHFLKCEKTPSDMPKDSTAIAYELFDTKLLGISFSLRIHSYVNKCAFFETNTIKCVAIYNSNKSLFIGSVFQSQKSAKSKIDIFDFFANLKNTYKKVILLGHLIDGHQLIKQKADLLKITAIPLLESEHTDLLGNGLCSDYILTNTIITKYYAEGITENLDLNTFNDKTSSLNVQKCLSADIFIDN